jgi:hypothetical protein
MAAWPRVRKKCEIKFKAGHTLKLKVAQDVKTCDQIEVQLLSSRLYYDKDLANDVNELALAVRADLFWPKGIQTKIYPCHNQRCEH